MRIEAKREKEFNDVLCAQRVGDDGYKVAMIKSMKNRRHIEDWPMRETSQDLGGRNENNNERKQRICNQKITAFECNYFIFKWQKQRGMPCQPLTMTE